MTRSDPSSVAVIAFDGMTPFHLSVPCLVFSSRLGADARSRFELTRVRREPRSAAGHERRLRHRAPATAWMRSQAPTSSSCRPGTTTAAPPRPRCSTRCARRTRAAPAWWRCAWAPSRWPRRACWTAARSPRTGRGRRTGAPLSAVKVDPDVLYVDDGDVLTSAGVAAGIDCCLHLLRRLCGADAANHGGAPAGGGAAPPGRPGPVHRTAAAGIAQRRPAVRVLDWVSRISTPSTPRRAGRARRHEPA
jgi:hypothetical protein